jgi:hypothetical protein
MVIEACLRSAIAGEAEGARWSPPPRKAIFFRSEAATDGRAGCPAISTSCSRALSSNSGERASAVSLMVRGAVIRGTSSRLPRGLAGEVRNDPVDGCVQCAGFDLRWPGVGYGTGLGGLGLPVGGLAVSGPNSSLGKNPVAAWEVWSPRKNPLQGRINPVLFCHISRPASNHPAQVG